VSHVHVHILPRRFLSDRFANNDDIYPTLEAHEKQLAKRVTHMESKQARTTEQGVQLDHTASSSESSNDGSGKAIMGSVATLNELIQSSGGPTSGTGSSQESELLRIDDEERKPRSLEEMEREAEWLKTFMKEVEDEASATSSTY
jgi:bis(5'-adenosyl)-triphosphatase